MSHPFGDLLTQHLSRKHGLSQSKLAHAIHDSPSTLSRMCKGERLRSAAARTRVLRIIVWLYKQGALDTPVEAHALLAAANMEVAQPGELQATLAQLQHTNAVEFAQLQATQMLELEKIPSLPASVPATPGHHLPTPDYAELFGVQTHIDTLSRRLSTSDSPRLLSIEGLGGIGKTALATAVARQLLQQSRITDVFWLSARQEQFSLAGGLHPVADAARTRDDLIAQLTDQVGLHDLIGLSVAHKVQELQPILYAVPYLVVVDNLETLTDVHHLLPELHTLAGATRFVLTSRHTLQHFPYVCIFTMPELSLADSQALLECELARRGHITMPATEWIVQLYEAVGGLPLALKLAAAQMGRLPLNTILQDVQRAGGMQDALYTYIYQRTWQLLSNNARRLLLALLSIPQTGEDLAFIQLASELSATEFHPALTELLDYSLLEVHGTLQQPRYYLHRLTITFLRTTILQQWA